MDYAVVPTHDVKLVTRAGGAVATVSIPIFDPPAEGVLWGERSFFRGDDGIYREGILWGVIPGYAKKVTV